MKARTNGNVVKRCMNSGAASFFTGAGFLAIGFGDVRFLSVMYASEGTN